jgi:hypothetical protein
MDTSTIQAAINAAANVSPAGTVTLGAGTFLIDSQLMVTGGVTLVGQGWENTIIKQTANGQRVAKLGDGAKLEGATITGGRLTAKWEHGAGIFVEDGTISWCCITNNSSTATHNVWGVGVYMASGTIDHSVVAFNQTGSVTSGGGGIGGYNLSSTIVIDTCLIYGNSVLGSDNGGVGGGIAFSVGDPSVTVRNSTVAGNSANGSGGGLFTSGTKVKLINCIVSGNTAGTDVSGTIASSSSNNLIGGAPAFVDAANGDYHLSASSPAIGVGTTYTGIGVDLDNVAFANPPSVGCYELSERVADPVFNPESGVAFYPTTNVTLTCATEGATIYYTTDGSTPTDSSTAYSGAIALSATTTIKARAYATGKGPSAIVSATYTYQRPTPQPTEFAKSIKITLTNALASTEITTGVPALVRLKEEANGGIVGFDYDDFTLAKGGDMMFVDSNGNPLPHEVDTWDTTGESLVWVKLPSTAASTKITMYYGKGTTSTASSTDVWSNYVGVWHLNEASGNAQDSTGHGLVAAPFGANASADSVGTACKVGNGRQMATAKGNKSYLAVVDNALLDCGDSLTFSGWFKATGTFSSYSMRYVSRKSAYNASNGWEVEAQYSNSADNSATTVTARGAGSDNNNATVPDVRDNWLHLTLVYDVKNLTYYVNGASQTQRTMTAASSDNDLALAFGNNPSGEESNWVGFMDELRLSADPVSAEYAVAEYKAMNTAETDIFEYGEAQDTASDDPGDPDDPDDPAETIVPGETPAATRQTIQDAIDAAANLAVPGTVTLGDGLFEIDAQLMVTGGVTLVGQGWTNTVVKQSTAATRCMIIDDEAKVEGVTITGGQETAANGAGAGAWVKSGTISWCCISNNTSTANNVSGCGVSFSGGLGVIDHSIVTDNIALSGQTVYGCGIGGLDTAGPVTIDTCLITHNLIKGGGSGGGIGIKNLGGDCIVRNCTVVGNTANTHTAGIRLENRASGNSTAKGLLINTIAVGNMHSSNGSEMNIADNFVFDKTNSRNCLFGLESETGMASSSLFGAPGFVNAESGDYRLYQDSQAAAGGVAYTGIGSDIDNVAFAATPSIGCYQYTALTANPTFSIESGTLLDSATNVTLSCATEGAKIYYTTDGSLPTESSTEYTAPVQISATTTINARAYADGLGRSGVASAYYPYVLQPGETPAATRQTIQDAIDAAAKLTTPGTVTLGDGLFEIDAQLMVTGGVTLVGQGWDDTVIKQVATTPSAETRCVVVDGGAKVEQVTLTGARVTGGNYTYGGGALVNDGTISWCCITNNSLSTANVKYGGGVHITKGSIDHSIIANNAVSSASGTCGGGGIGIYQPTGKILIDACLVAGNSQSKGQGGAGLFASFLNNHNLLTVRNTTIVDNHASGDGGGIYVTQNGTQPDFALVNCVLADNTAAGEGADQNLALPASCVSGYAAQSSNNLFANGTTALGTDSQSVAGSGSAWFVDAADGDYRLGSGSPAIGKGTTYEGIGVGLDNVAFAAPPSMGCYEYGDLTATPTFTPASGEIFYYTLDVEIACTDSGAVIYYTTDGTVPTTESTPYTEPITLSATTTVKARAYVAGKGLSAVASATYTHEIPEELSFYTPHVEPNSLGADISVTLAHVGQGATVADVYIAWGTDYDHLCTPVLVAENVVAKQRVAYSIDNLENTTHYVFRLSAENDQHRSCTRDGEFTTLSHEYLALSSPTVTEVAETSAKLGVGVVALGEHVNSARVVLKWGTDPNDLSQSKVLDPAALEGAALVETLNGLTANTLYYFSFEATSDAETPEVVSVSGSFMTGDPALESATRSKGYPSSVESGKAVTYDADAAGDPVTLEPGQPYCVVNATGYTYVYHSTVGSGADYVFRNEADFRYNASARIGNTYYLFLSDAVDALVEGDTIELLRNNYAVGELMTIATRLTIRGNGYVVKVDEPFTDDSGYVDLNCTTDVKTIFQIDNGGDVLLEDMTIMGGGQNVGGGTGAGTHDVHTYAVVVADLMDGVYQTSSTGVLEMRHVTITRSQGGLFTAFGTKVYAENCNLVRNARYCGGGLYNRGFLVMVGSSLSENRSLSNAGGGAAAENQGDMYMNNCVICNNGSTEVGGAINQFNSGNIQTGNGCITRLYLMNSTLTGNFSSWTSDGGGGIGSHSNVACTNLDIYAVNVLLCNNYYYNTANQTLTDSDFFVKDGTTMADNNLLYSVYGRINASSSVSPHVTECWQLSDPSAQSVFKGYTQSARVYEQSKTTAPITGAALESDADQPLARYAPIFDGSLADVGTDGVYTYFDASDWRHEVVKMSYKTIEGTMTALGKCAAASEADIVTTFYESSFAYGVDDREIGIVGASGFGANVRSYTLYLVRNPQNGTVSKNLTLNGMSYPEGSEVTVVATPEFACTFLGWYDENDQLVSDKAAYVFTMDSDKHLYAQFSGPSDTVTLNVDCEQAVKGTHTKFPIKVTTDWLGKAFPKICPNGAVTSETKSAVEAALNAPDSANGLNHVWQDYVLGGMLPGDEHGRIWIRADQTADKATLRFRMQELAKTQGCGFDVKYRLLAMTPGVDADYNREGAYASSGTFVENITSDQRVHRVIDMIFVPDGYQTSCEYVTTVNTAGVLRVASEKAVEIVSTPWAGFSPSSNPAVAATDYVKASCLSVGDVLYVYDKENSNYLAWSVQENGTWAALDTYLIVNGAVSYVGGADATRTNSLPRGAGAWLERKDPTKPIYLYGQYDPTPATTSLEPGFNLVGSPWSAPFDVSTLVPAETGDRIVIPTGGAPINCTYDATKHEWGWYKSVEAVLKDKNNNPILHPVTHEPLVGVTSVWTTDGLELPVGLGFWYYSDGSAASELAWPTAQQ